MGGGTTTTRTTPLDSPHRAGAARGALSARGRRRRRAHRDPGLDNASPQTRTEAAALTDQLKLRIERVFEAPPDAVFDAWTSEEVLRRWFHAGHDWETTEAEVDLRIGGTLRLIMRDPHKDAEYGGTGRYTEIDRPRRLAWTWVWDDREGQQLIEIDFEEVDEGTRVQFTHTGLLDEEDLRSHEDGWTKCFDNLDRAVAETARPS